MTINEFNKLLEERIIRIRNAMEAKAGEYASDDRLHNFKANVGGIGTLEEPEQVLWGYLRKHLQSIYDLVAGLRTPSIDNVSEKIGDAINYLILLEAIFVEKLRVTDVSETTELVE